ncbi:MAG: YraN family protein [Gemmatimonadota bacterium]
MPTPSGRPPFSHPPHAFGRRAEDAAAAHLEAAGWGIVARNVRWRRKEIDIVARRGGVVAFVEVKARAGEGFGGPLAAITWRKRREIALVARWWIAEHGRPGERYRFDAVAVHARPDSGLLVEHHPGAWRL